MLRNRRYPALLALTLLVLLAGAAAPVSPLAASPPARHQGRIAMAGQNLKSGNYIQTVSLIGQDVILGAGSSAHYVVTPTNEPPVPQTGAAARLWALYE